MKPPTSSLLFSALGLALGATVALGLARFSYALVLPAMRQDLNWNYVLAGGMNTANAVGYLLGALAATRAMRLLGTRLAFIGGLLLTALALALSALLGAYEFLLLMRLLAGVGGAVVFIAGGVLIAHVAQQTPTHSGQVLGIYYAGVGFGILLSGVSLPFLLEMGVDWRRVWWLLGLGSLGLGSVAAWAAWQLPEPASSSGQQGAVSPWRLFWAMLAYFCFALGYIAYMTFAVALVRQNGASTAQVALFWATLGITTMLVPRFWAKPITHWQAARGMAAAMTVVALGAAVPMFSSQFGWMLFSALCFGSFLSVVASTTALARRYLPFSAWSAGITLFTIVFAAGQSLGPVLSGFLSDQAGGLQTGLAWSAGILFLGAVLALLQGVEKDQGVV
jgi:predicted MFS family arabinose efflux permease